MPNDLNEGRELQGMTVEGGTVAMISRAELDQQITTAKRFPRSITRFLAEAAEMVTLNESIAQQCIYALPRDGKVIEGASARFGEIVASAWGNCRAGARIVNEGPEFVTAQGVFHDLERNSAITYEVQRRITDKNGRRYKPDMIGVTANAACSIALRNAILKGVPKAFWEPLYRKARAVVAGDLTTLANKRANAIKEFVIFGITEAQILGKLNRVGVADITVEDLVVLFGLLTAIKDGDTTAEQAFAADTPVVDGPKSKAEAAAPPPVTHAPIDPVVAPAQVAATDAPKVNGNGHSTIKAPSGALKMMHIKAEAAGKSDADVAAFLKVEKIDDLTVDQVNTVMVWLRGE